VRRVVFLPGAAGSPDFWRGVSHRLPPDWEKVRLAWPGAGDEPGDPSVTGFPDLVERAAAALGPGSDVVAQSMGCIVAIALAALRGDRIRRLVLAATSGGVDVCGLGGRDWRPEYRAAYPGAADWVYAEPADQTAQIRAIAAPTLLLWGEADQTSPVAVGRRLAALLPDATLRVIPGGDHGFAAELPDVVAPLIAAHLG
jgi:pimeloyl-ACP methyl ester carboxylesterase